MHTVKGLIMSKPQGDLWVCDWLSGVPPVTCRLGWISVVMVAPPPECSLLRDFGLGHMFLTLPYSLFRTGLFRQPMCPSGDKTKKNTDPVSALR